MKPLAFHRLLWRMGLILALALSVATVSLGGATVTRASGTNDTTVTPGPAWTSAVGVSHTQTIAHWLDADNAPEHFDLTVTVTWGDGSSDSCVLNSTGTTCMNATSNVHLANCNAQGEDCDIIGTHTYGQAGTFTITIVVNDPDQMTQNISTSITATVGAATASGSLTATKYVRDVTTNTAYSSSTSAYTSDVVRYEIVVTNTSTTAPAHGVYVTDALQPGELFITGSCHPSCTFDGATVTFSPMDLGSNSPGLINTGTFVFDVFIPRTTPTGTVITNTASVFSTDAGSATTNSTTVTVLGSTPPPCTAACYPSPCTTACYPSPCYTGCAPSPCAAPCYSGCAYAPCYTGCSFGCGAPCSYGCGSPVCSYGCGATSCYYGSYCGAITSQQTTVCGVISAYTAAGSGPGSITINGVTYTLMPYMVPGGATFTPGGSYCMTFYVNAAGQVAQMTVQPNVAGAYYACGVVSPYTAGYPPYPYAPYPGYSGAAGTGPYPVAGTYGGYSWSGPIMVGGYPYPVAAGATFPYQPSYGNPYCFLTSPAGYVSGCVCSIPVAAHAVEVRSGVRTGKKFSL